MNKLDDMPICEMDDIQQTRWLPIEGAPWVLGDHCIEFLPTAYEKEEIKRYLDVQLKSGNMVTFNVLTDMDGTLNPMIVDLFDNIQKV